MQKTINIKQHQGKSPLKIGDTISIPFYYLISWYKFMFWKIPRKKNSNKLYVVTKINLNNITLKKLSCFKLIFRYIKKYYQKFVG